ncbi:type I polyketide synthase, partial [Tsukamurella soli]|uniref:type I polyketide synthase n=1 Tax=Tsukamurella soli TaxID=644556 RepID=UPI0031EBC476
MVSTYSRVAGMSEAQRGALGERFDQAARIATAEPIAVVGIGCRFPGGASGPDAYWSLLESGTDAVVEVPGDRWDADAYYDADPAAPGRMPSKWGGFLGDIRGFDAEFFGIAPREAEQMDPQQRLLLEVAWEALENAGLAPDDLAGVRAAVMAGVYYNEYQTLSAADPDAIDAYSATGNAHSVTVGRVAYLLGLRGPAVAIDTACSSSLVAVHLACQSLRLRESDLALAGGVNLILRPETQLALGKWGMLSPRGRCNAFDAGADGFVRGEGAGVVVLKRLTDAVRDGDRVLAVVRGSAVNQDGRSNGLTAPNAPAQREVITRALGDVPPSSVHLVETHGTGTALGDPIEFDALSAVYGRGDAPCALGAVKSNMGHLEAAAGIAGFIKAVLAVERGAVPANLHFSRWNPAIDATGGRLFVPTETAAWPATDGPRRAGVSSFGLGGTNVHIVLEQGPTGAPAVTERPGAVTVLPVSGRSGDRVAAQAATLADWIEGPGRAVALADVAYSLARTAGHGNRRAVVVARDHDGAVAGLRAVAVGEPAPGVSGLDTLTGPARAAVRPAVVFVFSGQGSQWAGMGRRLLAEEPAFAAAIAEIDPEFRARAGFSLRGVLEAGEPVTGIDRIQPVLVGVQLALVALWRAHGVTPDAVIGHSMGEVAAAVTAGALSLADGLTVITTRSRLMRRELSGRGAMALLELDAGAADAAVADFPDVSVAVIASPSQTVVAGPPDQVDAVIAAVASRNLLARRVEVDVASHHATVDPILAELRTALSGIAPTTPSIPLFSTVRPGETAPVMDADYWVDNLRQPVQFTAAVAAAAQRFGTFIEASPHPLLTHGLAETIAATGSSSPFANATVLPTLLRGEDETVTFHTHRADLTAAPPAPSEGRLVDLPPRPWRRTQYWARSGSGAGTPSGAHPLLGVHVELPGGGHVWQADVGTAGLPWLGDHRVHGQAILPAAGFAEIALAAAADAAGPARAGVPTLRDLEVEQMLPLAAATHLATRLTDDADGARIEIHSRSADGVWTRHAVARVAGADDATPGDADLARPVADGTVVAPADFYAALRRTGAHHDRAFAALTRIVRGAGAAGNPAAEADVVLPDEASPNRRYLLHPVLLDAALQTLAAAMPAAALGDSGDTTYLPVSIESIRVLTPGARRAHCHAVLRPASGEQGDAGRVGDLLVTDAAGAPIAEVRGVFLRRVQRRTVPLPLGQKLLGTEWVEAPLAARSSTGGAGSWLVLADRGAEAAAGRFAETFASPERRVVTAGLAD